MNQSQIQTQFHFKSKLVDLYLVATEYGLSGIYWKKQSVPTVATLKGSTPQIKILKIVTTQLEQYFKGKRQHFDLPVDIIGTDFQIKVWKALAQIPFGETASYADIAKKIKSPKAVRAVGTANSKNPICIIVPCHRVITNTGKLGGYAGGTKLKQALLDLEQA
jgi:methylated-DNA-[protein]-cysteine S-methyltransferase